MAINITNEIMAQYLANNQGGTQLPSYTPSKPPNVSPVSDNTLANRAAFSAYTPYSNASAQFSNQQSLAPRAGSTLGSTSSTTAPIASVGTNKLGTINALANQNVNNARVLMPEQQDLLNQLYGYAKTGSYGNQYTAGTAYGQPTGYYQLGEGEMDSYNALQDMMSAGLPTTLQMAREEIGNVLGQDAYDPYNEKGSFKGFKESVATEQQQQSDVLNRNLAAQGDLYSTRLIQEQGELADAGQKALTSELGRLYDVYTGRRQEAVGQATDLGRIEELLNMQRLEEQRKIGETQRLLQDQQLKEQYAEWLRSRKEIDDVLTKSQNIVNMNYKGSSSSSSGSASGSSKSQQDQAIWNKVNNMYPEGTQQSVLNSAYEAEKRKAASVTNPFGFARYDGSSPAISYGRQNDPRATGWIFRG